MNTQSIIIGTRGSELALWQADFLLKKLQTAHTAISFNVKVIKTKGDKILNTPLFRIGDKGLFTKELEDELFANKIDIAVHSLKDMQTTLPQGLMIGAILERENPQDVLISKKNLTLTELPYAARLATSSIRRQAELLAIRPDFQFENIRGNIQTRIKTLFNTPTIDAMVLAKAGIVRLKLTEFITQELDTRTMIPAAAQGAIGIEIRTCDKEIETLLHPFDHTPSRLCCTAERSFLNTLEGGCQTPIGILAETDSQNHMHLSWFVKLNKIAAHELKGNLLSKSKILTVTHAEEFGRITAKSILTY